MTLIIGYVDNQKSYIASDSMGSDGYSGLPYKNKKIFKKDEVLIGGAGSFKQLQLIEKTFNAPKRKTSESPDDYLFSNFIPKFIDFLNNNNRLQSNDGVLENPDAEYVFVYDGRIFRMQSDLALMETECDYETAGEGAEYAHAVLTTLCTVKEDIPIEDRIYTAMALTSNYILSVDGPVEIISM